MVPLLLLSGPIAPNRTGTVNNNQRVMKNPSLILCFVYALLATVALPAQSSLRVGDPRNSWWTEQGTITEATVSVKPQGAYVEYGLYLTFSATGTQWAGRNDLLEVALYFELPPGAIVNDSIMDRQRHHQRQNP